MNIFLRCNIVLLLLGAISTTTAAAAEKPNIVFILADDLGYGDIEAFGGEHCNIDTPHFDALCRDGTKFTNAHVTNSVCVPSRTSIMTGRYAWRFGKDDQEKGGPWGFIGLRFPTTQHTVGKMLQDAGYTTGYVGKWHLGTRMTTKDGKIQNSHNTDFTKPIQIGPPQSGFDESFILPGSLDMYPYVYARNNRWLGEVNTQKGWSAFNRVGPTTEDFEDFEVLGIFCDEADTFISAQAKSGKPFFLYVALTAPHTPTSPAPEFKGKSRIGIYGDFVMNTDACIGRVVAALEKAGVGDNTLVIASSDHGPANYAGKIRKATKDQMREMEKDGHRANGPWRGYKFSAFEGGLRVPFAAKWPGNIPAGSVCDALVGLNDLMATWAEVSGAKLGDSEGPDSISMLPLLKDPGKKPPRTSMIVQGTRGNAFIDRDGWKLLLCPGSASAGNFPTAPESGAAWRAALKAFGRNPANHAELEQPPFLQLYKLTDDPGETKNVAALHPDRVKKMIASVSPSHRKWPKHARPETRRRQAHEGLPIRTAFRLGQVILNWAPQGVAPPGPLLRAERHPIRRLAAAPKAMRIWGRVVWKFRLRIHPTTSLSCGLGEACATPCNAGVPGWAASMRPPRVVKAIPADAARSKPYHSNPPEFGYGGTSAVAFKW